MKRYTLLCLFFMGLFIENVATQILDVPRDTPKNLDDSWLDGYASFGWDTFFFFWAFGVIMVSLIWIRTNQMTKEVSSVTDEDVKNALEKMKKDNDDDWMPKTATEMNAGFKGIGIPEENKKKQTELLKDNAITAAVVVGTVVFIAAIGAIAKRK